jgi:hypothetical protein
MTPISIALKETELLGTSAVYIVKTVISTTNRIHYGTEASLELTKKKMDLYNKAIQMEKQKKQ